MEKELDVEIQRRTESNRALQVVRPVANSSLINMMDEATTRYLLQWFDQRLTTINQRLRQAIDERTTTINRKFDELAERIDELQENFQTQKREVLQEVEERGEGLAAMLNEFKVCSTNFRADTDTLIDYIL